MDKDDRGHTHREPVNNIRKGDVILINKHPCKVIETKKSCPGKHGHAKVHIYGFDIFTGKKYDMILHDFAKVVVTEKVSYLLLDVDEEFGSVCVLTDRGETRHDLDLPEVEELRKEIVDTFRRQEEQQQINVIILKAMGKEQIVAYNVIKHHQ